MPATNFEENFIPKVNDVLKFVLESPLSDFYRNKCRNQGAVGIDSYEDFGNLPFLTKDEFLSVDVNKRTFVPEEEIVYYAFSSGTTGSRKPAVIPFSSFGYETIREYGYKEDKLKNLGVRRVLVLLSPISPAFFKYLSVPKKHTVAVAGDINNLKLTAVLAKELGIEAIFTTSTVLYFFIDYLKEAGFDLGRIRWINLGGEFCSGLKLEYFKKELPNASINFFFATAEIGGNGRGYRCERLALNEPPNVFHPVPWSIVEVAGENGGVLGFGEAGELVHTDLERKAFPLIRYKTGDTGSLSKSDCPCGNGYIIALGGRSGFDALNFSGIILSAEAIDAALASVKEYVEPKFQMHVFEKEESGRLKPKLEINLRARPEHQENAKDPYFKEILAERISDSLRLSSKSTLKQLVRQNVFLPLEIVFVENWPQDHFKSKNIISHL